MISTWTTLTGHLQGDISYILRKVSVDFSYVNFELITMSQAFQEFDLALEYRLNNKEEWREDAIITKTTANYLKGNKLYGLSSSKYGVVNNFQWKYSENNLFFSNTPQIRLRVLPRIRVFSTAGNYHQISSLYGDSLINFDGQSRHSCIGINQSGQYMCIGTHVFYIIDSLDADEFSTSSSSSSTEIRSSSSSSSSSTEVLSSSSLSSKSSSSSSSKSTSSSNTSSSSSA